MSYKQHKKEQETLKSDPIYIVESDETGELRYALVTREDPEFWIYSTKTYAEAIELLNSFNWWFYMVFKYDLPDNLDVQEYDFLFQDYLETLETQE